MAISFEHECQKLKRVSFWLLVIMQTKQLPTSTRYSVPGLWKISLQMFHNMYRYSDLRINCMWNLLSMLYARTSSSTLSSLTIVHAQEHQHSSHCFCTRRGVKKGRLVMKYVCTRLCLTCWIIENFLSLFFSLLHVDVLMKRISINFYQIEVEKFEFELSYLMSNDDKTRW